MKPIFQLFGTSLDVFMLNLGLAIPLYFVLKSRLKRLIQRFYLARVSVLATFVITPFFFIGTIVGLEEIKTHFPDSAFVKTARLVKHRLIAFN